MEKIEYISKEELEEEILKNKQLHKEICIFILNAQKEVLLQKRSPNKKYIQIDGLYLQVM